MLVNVNYNLSHHYSCMGGTFILNHQLFQYRVMMIHVHTYPTSANQILKAVGRSGTTVVFTVVTCYFSHFAVS